MNLRVRELATAAFGQAELRRRLVLLLAIYFGVAGILATLTFQQRSEAIASTEKALSAFAILTEEQTTRTFQSTEQTLETAEIRVASAMEAGTANEELIRTVLSALSDSQPFLKGIIILDSQGHILYTSRDSGLGQDISDRAYFVRHRDNPESKFRIGAPFRSSSTGEWIIPASKSFRHVHGEFNGVIVAGIDPTYFGRLWTNDKTIEDQATVLWRNDSTVMMRSPFEERVMGANLKDGLMASYLNKGSGEGTLRGVTIIDGRDRLIAYRRITAYPDFSIAVTQITQSALGAWLRTAWIVALGWAAAGVALAWLAIGLVRESNVRQATQDRFSRIFKANPYPMAVMDRETRRLLAVNDAAVAQYGWSREEALAMVANDFYPPEDLPALEAKRLTEAVGDSHVVLGLRHRKKDGTIFDVEMHTQALELDNRPAVLTIMENVTVRHSVEAQLRQSQKMEAVGQLTGGIAHDFNNILFVILANSDALVEEDNLSGAVTERLDRIAEAVGRASALTRQLLAFSRKQTLRPQQTDLNDLVSDTGKLLRRALGAGIEIESILPEGLCIANIDRSQLETALVNLCINARDAMPDGGRLLIETRNVILDEDYAALNPGVKVGAYAMLAVTDTGTGIPQETLRKVFEPFFTTKEVGKGTGLGLSMVYGFIKQSEGHIKIYSEVGVGTSFKLYLPCSGQLAEQASPPRNASLPRGDERILVVEDEPQVRVSIVEQLRSLGYSVSEAGDAQSGIAAFEATEVYDLLLTDVIMPGLMNGKALADEVKRRWPKTNVVFMSGFTETSVTRHGRLEEDALLLSKPFRKAELAQMVRRALDSGGSPDRVLPEAA